MLKALIARIKQKFNKFSSKCPHCHVERTLSTLAGELWAHCEACNSGEHVRQ